MWGEWTREASVGLCVSGTVKARAWWVRARPREGWLRPPSWGKPYPPSLRPREQERTRAFLRVLSLFNYNITEQGEGL